MATVPPDRDQLTYVWAASRIGTGAMTTTGTDPPAANSRGDVHG